MNAGDILWSTSLAAVLAGGLGWLLIRTPGRRWIEGGIVASMLAAALVCYLSPGEVPGGDGHSHLSRTWLWLDIVRGGELPIWTWSWYAGYPFTRLYGFMYYALSAGMTALAGLVWGTKLTLWILHVASGLAAWWAARTMESRRRMRSSFRLIVAVSYAVSFQHVGAITAAGALPLALIYPLAPLPFGLFMLAVKGKLGARTAGAGIGLALAAACWTHLQYGLLLAAAFAAWATIVALGIEPVRRHQTRTVVGFTVGVTSVLVAWQIAEWLAWSDRLMVVPWSDACVAALPSMKGHLHQMVHLVRWSRGFDDWALHYVGWTVLGLGSVGGLAVLRSTVSAEVKGSGTRRRAGHLGLQAAACMTLLGLVGIVVAPRAANTWLWFVCLLAGWGTNRILGYFASRGVSIRPAIAVALLLAMDLGPSLHQRPYGELDADAAAELLRTAEGRHLPRVLVAAPGTTAFWRGMDIVDTGTTTPLGAMPQLATRSLEPLSIVALDTRERLEYDKLSDTRIPVVSGELLSSLALMGIQSAIAPDTGHRIDGATPMAMYAPTAVRDHDVLRAGRRKTDWRAIRRAFGALEDSDDLDRARLREVVARCAPDLHESTLQLVLLGESPRVRERVAGSIRGEQPRRPGSFQLVTLRQQHTRVELRYRAEQDGWLRLAYAHFPTHRVEVDGHAGECARTALGMTAIPVPAGEHNVALQATLAPWEWFLALLAIVGTLAAAGVTFAGLSRAPHRRYDDHEGDPTPTRSQEGP